MADVSRRAARRAGPRGARRPDPRVRAVQRVHGRAAVLGRRADVPACNVENASYGLSICAERVAATTAVAAGERRFDAVAVVGTGPPPAAAVRRCRQFLSEFGPTMPVAR